jgi:hypothetical protein
MLSVRNGFSALNSPNVGDGRGTAPNLNLEGNWVEGPNHPGRHWYTRCNKGSASRQNYPLSVRASGRSVT